MSQKTTQNTQNNTQEQSQEKLAYNPKTIESKIYEICKNRGYFEIDGNEKLAQKRQARLQKNGKKISPKDTHFCIMMPPPNVTGVLHIGHALTLSLQDIIVRFKRMQGYTTLYQPGLDHAGIATQNVVEKQLLAKGIKKEELGREKFINKVWEWKEESGGKILGQMEALGISPALSRTRFTMDKGLQQAVREAFVAWYEKGLIYEGDYMVNWCTHDGALSDIEVQYEAQDTKLYYIAYKIVDSNSSLGNHCKDFVDFDGLQASEPSSPPKSTKNSTSTTAPNGLQAKRSKNTKIVVENGVDFSEKESSMAESSLRADLKNPRGNLKSPLPCGGGLGGRVKSTLESSPKSSLDSNAKSSLQADLQNPHSNPQHTKNTTKPDNDKTTFPQDALVVATTRPETFFGDVAVMINPNDSRYAHLIGQKVILPLLEKEIPIIADSAVDMEFGTGVVKVTPAHDINDYEVGKRHGLENLVIFDEKGIFNQNAQGFAGRERLEAREDIVAALDSCGALLKTESYQNQVGTCYRCGNLIEPYISKQWFVSKQVASGAIKRVNDGEAKFYPSAWLNNFNAWMKELRPWCISRQLWWGHRIPIWDCQNPKCHHRFASKNEVESSCPKCGGEVVQVEDVLDTWFSSGLWAFSTLGWGNSSLGMQCDKILDFLECTDEQSANIPKNPKNLHSHTANTRIVDFSEKDSSMAESSLRAERSKNTRIVGENGGTDSSDCVIASEQSERGNPNPPSLSTSGVSGRVKSTLESSPKSSQEINTESSLRASDSERGNLSSCHTGEISKQKTQSDTSAFSKPKYGKTIIDKKIDCHANADAFARNDKIDSPSPNYQNMAEGATNDKNNPPSLAEGVRGRVKSSLESSLDSNTESSLRASDSERGNPKSPLPKLSKCGGGGLGGRVESTANDSSTPYTPDDLANFYPNSLLITGFDILFFWVARMLFSGESLLGKLPFRDIYLHALVRDENGQKMSKSRGNVIDPLEMIDKYGADSLRFSLAYLCAQGRDIRLSSAQLEISKNFANKLFNATQFLRLYASQIDSSFNGFCEIDSIAQYQTPLGKYAKSRLNAATSELINALESYRFNDGASVLYRFLWGEFCDWCIELAKAQKEAIHELGAVLIDALKLLHPYMPFISEELYHSLKGQTLECAQSIMIAEFPSDIARDLEVEAEFESIKNAIISLRRLKASVDLANKPIDSAYIELQIFEKDENKRIIAENYIQKLAKTQQVRILTSREGVFVDENKFLASKNGFFIPPELNIKNCVVDIGEGVKSYLPLDNIDLAPILSRLEAQKQKLQKEREKLESNLKNDRFLSNAPKEVVAKLESSLQEVLQKLEKVQSEIKTLDRG